MPHCPNCWSGVDALAGDCPHCAQPLAPLQVRHGRAAWSVGIAVAIASLGVAWLVRGGEHPTPGTAADRSRAEPPRSVRTNPPGVSSATGGESSTALRAVWPIDDALGTSTQALVLRSLDAVVLLAPIDLVLTNATPRWRGDRLDLAVIHAAPDAGWALLLTHGPLPPGTTAVEISSTPAPGDPVVAWTPDGQRESASLDGVRADGNYVLGARLPRGTVLVDATGRAIAFVLTPDAALPLEPLRAWLDRPALEPLAAARETLRRRDPLLLADDFDALLATGDATTTQLTQGLDDLRAAEVRCRDPESSRRIDGMLRRVARALIGAQLATDPDAALRAGRDALARDPADPELLATTIAAATRTGSIDLAVELTARLRGADLEGGAARFDAAVLGVAEQIGSRLQEGTGATMLAAAEQLALVAPQSALAQAVAAQALERADRLDDAIAAAGRARALDLAYDPLFERLTSRARQAAEPGVLRIPFDPAVGSIRVTVSIGGIDVPMVVDTGATQTSIPRDVAARLGLLSPASRRVTVETASGRVETESVRLPSMRIGREELRGATAVVLDLPGSLAGQGLLGMNALRRFDVQIDATNHELVLRRRTRR